MMTPPIHLVLAEVQQAALTAYAYGVLTAQAPDETQRRCEYLVEAGRSEVAGCDTSRVCAIGAALTEPGLYEGPVEQIFRFVAGEEIALKDLQIAHDFWCHARDTARFGDAGWGGEIEAERAFLIACGHRFVARAA